MSRRIRDLEEVRELVRAEARIEDVVQRFGLKLKGLGGSHYKAICPFHPDTDPSLGISVQKQLFRCHGCKAAGDVFKFVQLRETVSHAEAVEIVAGLVGFDLAPYLRDLTPQEREEQRLYGINEAVWSATAPLDADFDWVQERRFDAGVLDAYGVSYSAGQPVNIPGSKTDHKRLQVAWAAKWAKTVVVPLRNMSGRIAGFRSRTEAGKGRPLGPDESHPLPVPPLYGLYEARAAIRDAGGTAILVEGESDVWQMVTYGHANTVGMMGSKLGDEEVAYLVEHGVRVVVVMPDGDRAGREFAKRLAATHRKHPLVVKIASLRDGDPDEVLLRDPEEVQEALDSAVYSFEHLIRAAMSGVVLDSITDRVDVLMELRPYFSATNEYERDLATRELARRLDMDPDAVDEFFREAYDEETPMSLANVRGERTLLAGALVDEKFAGEVLLSVRSSAFSLAKHRRLFEVIGYLFTTRDSVNEDTVATYLLNRNEERLAAYVRSLADADDPESRSFMLTDVQDKAIRRAVQKEARDVVLRLGDTSNDARTLVHAMSASLAHAVMGDGAELKMADRLAREGMAEVLERVRNPSLILGVDLGPDWPQVNHTLRGLRPKRLIVLGAPTTVGKTAIAGCWVKRAAIDLGVPSTYITFETDEETLFHRIISSMSGVESEKIETGYMTAEELDAVQEASARFAASPLMITRSGQGLGELLALIRHDHLTRGTKLYVVDYLQLMYVEGWKDGRRDLELGKISGALLQLTRELDVAIVAVAMINREGSKKSKAGGTPSMDDTGDSIRIAQDADVFIVVRFKNRDEVENDGVEQGDRFLFIDKNRGGRRGIGVSVVADVDIARYREASSDPRSDRAAGERQERVVPGGGVGDGDAVPLRRGRRPRAGRNG